MSTKNDGPNPIDLHVGGMVRMRRKGLGMSQETLADALGLTFQQVQKYERGANRISASKLFEIARALQVTPAFFFPPGEFLENDIEASSEMLELMHAAGSAEMMRLYGALRADQRRSVINVARMIVEAASDAPQLEAAAA